MTESTPRPRWFTDTKAGHSDRYVDRFRRLAAGGADLDGEARFVDALLARHARVLDAGCGPGRVGAALHARGHDVVGVDADPVLIKAACADHPGLTWLVADLSTFDLAADGPGAGRFELVDLFDLVVLAGNVMVFMGAGTEAAALTRLVAHLRPGGRLVAGFATDREYRLADFDRDSTAAGLRLEHRFATWELDPWRDDADWAVSVLRRLG